MSSSQFTCHVCGQGFEQKSRLERHILTSHPEPAPSASDVEKALSGIKYPKSKEEIIDYIKSRPQIKVKKELIDLIQNLPKRTYRDSALSGINLPQSQENISKHVNKNIVNMNKDIQTDIMKIFRRLPKKNIKTWQK